MRRSVLASLSDLVLEPFWTQTLPAASSRPALVERTTADLVVVGGGLTGLWTAILAKEDHPDLDVVVLEAAQCGWAASTRNGGFVASSLTHGLPNGAQRFADELPTLVRLGEHNLDGIEATLARYDVDAEWERTGELTVATEDWQLRELAQLPAMVEAFGAGTAELWDAERIQTEVQSPTYLGAVYEPHGTALVHPGKLVHGLRDVCLRLGVRLYEHTKATSLSRDGTQMRVSVPYGCVVAPKVALATNVFPSLVRRARAYVVPVWDYVLVTEPLDERQRESIGWRQRQGIGDAGNQFHYYRLTADDRILWGGYDAIYYYGSGMDSRHEHRPETYARLAEHFFTTFPQLSGLRFSHAWGGAIDTCTRFCSFWGQAYSGQVAYVLGYTGLGVGATRFGARVMLDLLSGRATERTQLRFVRSRPLPFPPEPARYAGIQLTRWSIDAADHNQGRRNPWLRTLDRLGLGFDS